jgi:hypothetical protein
MAQRGQSIMMQYDDILTAEEIALLNNYFVSKEYSVENFKDTIHGHRLRYRNKHTDYDLENSIVHDILYPKIYSLIGDHALNSGAFLESHYPFGLHVDTNKQFLNKLMYVHSAINVSKAIIIPLVSSKKFTTVFFDCYNDSIDFPPDTATPVGDLFVDGVDLSHLPQNQRSFIADKHISGIFEWKTGSVAIWPRNQLHCSSNFYNTGLVKTAITLFI